MKDHARQSSGRFVQESSMKTSLKLPPIGGSNQIDRGPASAANGASLITDPLVAKGLALMDESDVFFTPVQTTQLDSTRLPEDNNNHGDDDENENLPRSYSAGHQSYKQRLNQYMAPLLQSMMSERPQQPHSYIVDYIKLACAGKRSKLQTKRPFERKSFLEYKLNVLDPTIMPLMAELFVKQPANPLQAIFQHAKAQLNISADQYEADLIEIDLFNATAHAVKTQEFAALHQAIDRAIMRGVLDHDNIVLKRAQKTQQKGEQIKERSRRLAQSSLAAAVRQAQKMLHGLPNIEDASKKLKRLAYLKAELGTAVARAHRHDVPDHDIDMKLAVGEIITIAHEFRRQQQIVQEEHRVRALASLGDALRGLEQHPGAVGILEFSLHRARALRCSPDSPEIIRAEEILVTLEELRRSGTTSFSLALVGKIKTQMSQQLKQARLNIEEIRSAQAAFDQQLEDSDDEFYRDLGFSDDDASSESGDEEEAHFGEGSKPGVV